ncbi:MAG: N-acetylmuramidase domain-containing protein [Crocinitomicaceae bacterium]
MKTIRHKSRSKDVQKLEEILISLGYNLPYDNTYFGKDTDKAVRAFQKSKGLVVDGIVGPNTWKAILAEEKASFNKMDKSLTEDDFKDFAKEFNLELASVKAVTEVESRGSGFLSDFRPIILFEGHIFWSQLDRRGLKPSKLKSERGENVLYSKWTKKHYQGGKKEYDRLEKAAGLSDDPLVHDAAYASASWGLFQIMGFHFKNLGFASVDHYVSTMYVHEREHLKAFGQFISITKVSGKPLLHWLQKKNWAKFAYGYNGSDYAKNNYDTKLLNAYNKHK